MVILYIFTNTVISRVRNPGERKNPNDLSRLYVLLLFSTILSPLCDILLPFSQ